MNNLALERLSTRITHALKFLTIPMLMILVLSLMTGCESQQVESIDTQQSAVEATTSTDDQKLSIVTANLPSGFEVHTVKEGESLFSVADLYSIEPETILWANYDTLKDNPNSVKQGMDLRIPPTDGVLYQWKSGDDLSSVAEKYSIDPESIAQWEGNELDYEEYLESGEIQIMPGQYIFIPQGIRPLEN
jgi:LysM repeat protein